MFNRLKDFAREHIACHPGLFDPVSFPIDLLNRMGEAGLLGLRDASAIARGGSILVEESGSLGFAIAWTTQSLVPLALDHLAGLPAEMTTGASKGCIWLSLAVSEPGAGSHPKYLKTLASPVEGGWQLYGEKAYVTNGPIASHLAVLAISDQTEDQKFYSLFLLPVTAKGLHPLSFPPFNYLLPAQHSGFRLENCFVADDARMGRFGCAYEDVILPFRSIEDAVGTVCLTGALKYAARRTVRSTGLVSSEEVSLSCGELAGLLAALDTLNEKILAALQNWTAAAEQTTPFLVAAEDLSRQCLIILRRINMPDDMDLERSLCDAEKYLTIARTARQARKSRLGRSQLLSQFSPENNNQ